MLNPAGRFLVGLVLVGIVRPTVLTDLKVVDEPKTACNETDSAYRLNVHINITARLELLRELMNTFYKGVPIDAYIIPYSKEHQNQFAFISGFNSSYKDAIVTHDLAILWTGRRLNLQADDRTDCNWLVVQQEPTGIPAKSDWLLKKFPDSGKIAIPAKSDWLLKKFPDGGKIAIDPKLISKSEWDLLTKELEVNPKIQLIQVHQNLLDELWNIKMQQSNNSLDNGPMNRTEEITNLTGPFRKACGEGGPVDKSPKTRINTTEKLATLRQLMRNSAVLKRALIDAYIIPYSERHQTRFVLINGDRRSFISGFNGSYGDAIVTLDKAVVWTDERFYLRADSQLDCNWQLILEGHNVNTPTKSEWLLKEFPDGGKIGVDPKLISKSQWDLLIEELRANPKIELIEVDDNLVEEVWKDMNNWAKSKMLGKLRKSCGERGHGYPPNSRVETTFRLIELRRLMKDEILLKGVRIDAYIVPYSDEHQTQFVSEYDERLAFISGFNGSYGDAIITDTKAVLWTDGRFHLQADDQMDCNWLLMRQGHRNIPTKSEWLLKEFPNEGKIGVDPKLISQSQWAILVKELRVNPKLELIQVDDNLIDEIWKVGDPPFSSNVFGNRPPRRTKDIFIWGDEYNGMKWTSKISQVRKMLKREGVDAMVVTALDEIAWLLNIRGRDIPFNPFVRSYVILNMNEVLLFVDEIQLKEQNIRNYFNETRLHVKDTVRIFDYNQVCANISRLSQAYQRVLLPSSCVHSEGVSRYIYECVPKAKRFSRQSPIIFLKAKKNPLEIQGMHRAHLRDAAAMCEFFAYIETRFKYGDAFSELEVVKIINDIRFEQKNSLGNSFRTIVAFAANGAFPRYEPTISTNTMIFDNSTLVLDSGGQYYDGTTDVTRTIHLGEPTAEQRQAYTRVLIGLIQLSLLTFPSKMKASFADVIARAPLWEVGLDYLHGTSYGVGAFLGVHESPILLDYNDVSKAPPETQLLQAGYFLTIGPAYYREGVFGVRLENVVEVVEKPWLSSSETFLGFRTVTLLPYEQKLINLSLLSIQHRRWLNDYHERVRSLVGAELIRQNMMSGYDWLMENTNNIPEYGSCNTIQNLPAFILFSNAFILIAIFI